MRAPSGWIPLSHKCTIPLVLCICTDVRRSAPRRSAPSRSPLTLCTCSDLRRGGRCRRIFRNMQQLSLNKQQYASFYYRADLEQVAATRSWSAGTLCVPAERKAFRRSLEMRVCCHQRGCIWVACPRAFMVYRRTLCSSSPLPRHAHRKAATQKDLQ
jgi:hypothetical protein